MFRRSEDRRWWTGRDLLRAAKHEHAKNHILNNPVEPPTLRTNLDEVVDALARVFQAQVAEGDGDDLVSGRSDGPRAVDVVRVGVRVVG